jgi:hypothetical protein
MPTVGCNSNFQEGIEAGPVLNRSSRNEHSHTRHKTGLVALRIETQA